MATDRSSIKATVVQSREEQLRFVQELMTTLEQERASGKTHSILELKGLGREIWKGIDAQAYVKRERSSWNG